MSRIDDGVRLAVGTFSVLPVSPPVRVDRRTVAIAVSIAPLAVLPVGLLVALAAWGARGLDLPALIVGAAAIGAGALATRGFHLDGLADITDALASSYDRERALTVARTGDVGPAGATALVLVLLIQATAAGTLAVFDPWGPVALGVLWCLARGGATVGLRRGLRAARRDGMGATFAGSVEPVALGVVWSATAAIAAGLSVLLDVPVLQGIVTVAVTLVALVLLVAHVSRRLGGIVGDAIGASVEVALMVLLIGFVAVVA